VDQLQRNCTALPGPELADSRQSLNWADKRHKTFVSPKTLFCFVLFCNYFYYYLLFPCMFIIFAHILNLKHLTKSETHFLLKCWYSKPVVNNT